MFASDTTPVTNLAEKLNRLVSKFGKVCHMKKLKINVRKTKVMRCGTSEGQESLTE